MKTDLSATGRAVFRRVASFFRLCSRRVRRRTPLRAPTRASATSTGQEAPTLRTLRLAAAATGIAVLSSLLLTACGGEHPGAGEMPPPPVTVAEVTPGEVEIHREYAARVRAVREVEVRARVGGVLEKRMYEEGQYVERGDILFEIDTEPFEIALRQAEADLGNALANRRQAEREWLRVSGLYDRNAVSERERDNAESLFELAQAQEELSRSRVADAVRNLDYTRVKAPLAGSTGLETLSEGSLIEAGQPLTRLIQQDPVHVRFSLPESDAALHREARRARTRNEESGLHRREVRLRLPDGEWYSEPGVLDFTDTTIDARTGTVTVRAVFENPDGDLIPGQFVRVRVTLEELTGVFAIEPTAISEGPEGPRVFILLEDDTVESRDVELGPVVDGRQVILSGLEDGERLVVNGHAALQDGMAVSAQTRNGEEN